MHSPRSGASASLVLRNDLSELQRVAEWVDEWAQQHPLPIEITQRLDLCSTEVVTNIISYAFDDNAAHQIVLRLGWKDTGLNFEVEDNGKPFNPLEAEEPPLFTSLEDAPIGGWGIPIIRTHSDALCYRRANGKNCLTVSYECAAAEAEHGPGGSVGDT
jgi:serine/threonine-protein kinase RsbW